jgi:2-polyprenyl-3-methyl-5-hydroxy-6-metoxy-1,4-benzoquinol methylase
MNTSNKLYDAFAPDYASYSKKREAYLERINKLIIESKHVKKKNMLDVGCGDGLRGFKLFRQMEFKSVDFIDSSKEMVKLCRQNTKMNAQKVDITSKNIWKTNKKYDAITCLWNVLGHVPTHTKRLQALKNMRKLLEKNGNVFLDVSNRFNVNHYGINAVMKNIQKDLLKPAEKNGDLQYSIEIRKGVKIRTFSHFFSPFEMEQLIADAGLKIESVYYIDYATGKVLKNFFGGQLFYILSKHD